MGVLFMRYRIKRDYNRTKMIELQIKEFTHKNFRAVCLTGALTVLTLVSVFSGDSANGAVSEGSVEKPSVQKTYDPKLLGSYTTTVDFQYMTHGNTQRKISAPYGALIGVRSSKDNPAFIPITQKVNWGNTLKRMWVAKLDRPDVSGATRTWADRIVMRYKNKVRDVKTIDTFVDQVDLAAREMDARINYNAMCSSLRISQCQSLQMTMDRIGGRNLVAYGMTELFPGQNGDFNYQSLDLILRNAGENYLDAIPAGGDDLLSKGLYQFTSLAIRRDDSKKIGGVTFVDNFAGMKLSGSVVHLKMRDSHKAAFAFATYNIANTMRGMNEVDAHRLATTCPISDVTELIAVSHHQPSRSWSAGRRWVHEGCNKPLRMYLNSHLTEYATKTAANYRALMSHP